MFRLLVLFVSLVFLVHAAENTDDKCNEGKECVPRIRCKSWSNKREELKTQITEVVSDFRRWSVCHSCTCLPTSLLMNSNLGGSEALLVDDRRAGLVMLLLGDPHGLEGWEGGQDGATDPSRVLSFWWSDDLDLRVVGGSGGDLFLHSLSKAGEQGGTS